MNKVTRTYDDAGRLSTVSDWLSHTTTYGYDADSNPTQTTYGNATTRAATYDNADRLMGITDSKAGTPFLALTYGRDSSSLLTSDTGTTYGYDPLNRVNASASTTYQYDKADQITQNAASAGTTTTLAYDIAGQLRTSATTNGQTQVSQTSFSFDANGNRTRTTDQNNANTTYAYDGGNRLTNFNGTANYTYNGDGLRMSKNTGGASIPYAWSLASGLPTILQEAANSYATGMGDLPLEQINGTTAYWYHEDQLGSIRGMTDSLGAVQQSYAYDAYGNLTGSSGALTNAFRFAGQYLDGESGLYYLRARYYDPISGQFTSADPISATTHARYVYVADSPENATDPAGLYLVANDGAASSGRSPTPTLGLCQTSQQLCQRQPTDSGGDPSASSGDACFETLEGLVCIKGKNGKGGGIHWPTRWPWNPHEGQTTSSISKTGLWRTLALGLAIGGAACALGPEICAEIARSIGEHVRARKQGSAIGVSSANCNEARLRAEVM